MGTSASSSGPGSGVPMVPPWVSDPNADEDAPTAPPERPVPVAPRARFGGARRAMGDFARTGNRNEMRRALGRYTERGMGGSRTAAARMSGAAARSGVLYGTLHTLAGTPTGESGAPPLSGLAGRPAREVIDAIVALVSPLDGSQDAESSQRAISSALSDLLEENPEADLGGLTNVEIDWVVERHLVYEIHGRVQLDIGKAVVDNAPSPTAGLQRLQEIQDYIQETVAASFRERVQAGRPLTNGEATALAAAILEDTFAVFKEYVR